MQEGRKEGRKKSRRWISVFFPASHVLNKVHFIYSCAAKF